MSSFPKKFLWGGAVAANQCEGGYLDGHKGLATIDVVPSGKDRFPVMSAKMKMLDCDDEHYYPSHEAINFYHSYKEDIALLAEMGLRHLDYLLRRLVYFLMGMMKFQMKRD